MLIEAIWTIWNLFIFLQKDYAHTKNIQRKTNDFHPLRNIRAHQKCRLCCFLCAYFCFLSWFLLAGVFYAQNLFVKKKINRFEIVQIASINTTTLQSTYQAPIYTHLFLLVIVCENESLLFMRIFFNVFYPWEPFLLMKIFLNLFFLWNFFYLWQSLLTAGISLNLYHLCRSFSEFL